MLHCGIGETHINGLLAAINIPVLSRSSIKEREREVGRVIETVAQNSSMQALQEEVDLQ